MQIGPAAAVRLAAVEQYKTEILRMMPEGQAPRGREKFDEISMSDFGRMLGALSARGNDAATALIGNVLMGSPDKRVNYFLQAYYAVLDYPFSQELVLYDRRGKPKYSAEYRALKRYLANFAGFPDETPPEEEPPAPPAGFWENLKRGLKKLGRLFWQDEEEKPEKKEKSPLQREEFRRPG